MERAVGQDVRRERLRTLAVHGQLVSHLGTACLSIAAFAAFGVLVGIASVLGPGLETSLAPLWLLIGSAVVLCFVALGATLRLAGDFVEIWAIEQRAGPLDVVPGGFGASRTRGNGRATAQNGRDVRDVQAHFSRGAE